MIGRYLDYSDKKFIEVGSLIIFTECPVRTSILGHSILIFDSIIVTGLNKGMENPHNEVVWWRTVLTYSLRCLEVCKVFLQYFLEHFTILSSLYVSYTM